MIMKTEEEKLRILIYELSKRIGQMQKFSSRYEIEKKNSKTIIVIILISIMQST